MSALATSGVPPVAAHLTPDYPQFQQCEAPDDGVTQRAWRGVIKPFSTDEDARSLLADFEADKQVWISAGRIRALPNITSHWANPLLVNMDISCEILLCEQCQAVPRAYLLSPVFPEYYANNDPVIHPHPRGDQTITYQGRKIPGLCIVSGAEFSFDKNISLATQFLDLTTQYVAKHLIWLRTRRLLRTDGNSTTVLYQPMVAEPIFDDRPRVQRLMTPAGRINIFDYWTGYWPGKHARAMNPLQHVQQIKPTQNCWCGAFKHYGACHRESDITQLSPEDRKRLRLE